MTVVVGIDPEDESAHVLEAANHLASRLDTDLEVVYVLGQSEFMDLQRTSVSETADGVDPDEVRAVATEMVREAAEDVLDEFEAVGLVGDAASELLNRADDRDAEYVVVGVRKRSPVGKAVFGSVSQDVMLSSDRPVVAVPVPERTA